MKSKITIKKIGKGINYCLYTLTGISIRGKFSLTNFYKLVKDKKKLQKQNKTYFKEFPITRLYACYNDKEENAGNFHIYFLQDLFVAQKIYKDLPKKHIDIGSRIDGFVAHVATFREIEVFDIRPLDVNIPNVIFKKADIMENKEIVADYTDSISSLHALEHFGLGRYGDKLDYQGFQKGFENITLMLRKGGKFYFSVPIGPQRIEFHAHRIFSLNYLIPFISKYYIINEFSYIDDKNNLYDNISLENNQNQIDNNFYCKTGCGIFELIKK